MKRESKKAGRKERRSKIKKMGLIKGRKAKIKVRGRKEDKERKKNKDEKKARTEGEP